MSSSRQIKRFIVHIIDTVPVVIFGLSECQACDDAMSLILEEGKDYLHSIMHISRIDLDSLGNEGEIIAKYLAKVTAQNTFPSIFIASQHVGGWDDLNVLAKGGFLKTLLRTSVNRI